MRKHPFNLKKMLRDDEKIVVTDYSLAHWQAQTCGININAFPRFKPDGFPKDVYDELRVVLKNYVNASKPSCEQRLLKIFQPKPKIHYKPIESMVDPQ